ncbi:hypothetical protein KAR91_07305 [Candidatus Pacearchaeota archaeon]|nr:hypothetical protein [Candidatus Pacearchaeota archaeon]
MPGRKSDESLQILSSWVCSHPVRKTILFAIDTPKLLSHMFRHHIQKLVNLKIIRCLTPRLKPKEPGKVYDLTRKGLRIKEILCDKENKDCIYRRLENIDWYKYGKVILGPQRVVLLRALDNCPQRICEIVGKIKRKLHYKTYLQKTGGHPSDKAWGMVRQNVNNTLRWLIREGLVIGERFARRRKRHKPITKYRLSEEGELFRRQIEYLAN